MTDHSTTLLRILASALMVILISQLRCTKAQQQQYRISQQQRLDAAPNIVTLDCGTTGGGSFPSTASAHFWVNTTNLRYVAPLGYPTWRFEISREFEGEYFCGLNTQGISQPLGVIYRPQIPNFTLQNLPIRVVRVQAGDTAIIPPYIGPGVWHSRYHIDWTDASGHRVGRIDGLRHSTTFQPLERYSVDIGDFSLRIQNVQRSDAGLYIGVLGVIEGSIIRSYDKKNTTLFVYESPVITVPPVDRVIQYQERTNISFSCTAQGFPRPHITWTHNNEPTFAKTINDVTIGDNEVQSTLTMSGITALDSGQVKCIAMVIPGGNVRPLETTAVADLSVLKISNALVKQTVDGGLVFLVRIVKELPADVYIHLAFEGDLQDITSTNSFHHGTELPFFVDNPPFSVNHFSVAVTVMHGNTHSAPFQIVSNKLLSDCDKTTLIIVVPIILGLLVICAILCIVICFCIAKCCNFFTVKQALKHATTDKAKKAILGSVMKSMFKQYEDEGEWSGTSKTKVEPQGEPLYTQNECYEPHTAATITADPYALQEIPIDIQSPLVDPHEDKSLALRSTKSSIVTDRLKKVGSKGKKNMTGGTQRQDAIEFGEVVVKMMKEKNFKFNG